MNFSSVKNKKRSVSDFSEDFANKQNQSRDINQEKDLTKILSKFNSLILQNKQAINQLQRKINQQKQIQKQIQKQCKKQMFDQQIEYNSNYLNQTLAQSNSKKSLNYSSLIKEFNYLSRKIEKLQFQLKHKETMNQLNLEKRLSQKGQKNQIQKSINLAKLLVVEIEQIKERFQDNQRKTKMHSQLFDSLQSKISILQQTVLDQGQRLKQKLQTIEPNQNQSFYCDHTQSMKRMIQDNLASSMKSAQQQILASILKAKQEIQPKRMQFPFKTEIKELSERLSYLQNQAVSQSKQKQKIKKELNISINNFSQEIKKINQKTKKDNESFLIKKIQSFDKSYTNKNEFLSNSSEVEGHLNSLSQKIIKFSISSLNKSQQLQKKISLLQSLYESNYQALIKKISEQSEQNSKKFDFRYEQFSNKLTKYVKIQSMKKYFELENQKVYKIINSNFQQQKLVNSTLCSENILARWLWSGQEMKGGNLISWGKQVVNTLPQNFKFNQQSSSIIQVSSSGIYKFELGFYGKKKPSIQILINGKVIMSAVNSSSYVIHHSSGKLKGTETTEISGLTLVDFFLIPENSRIAIAYSGDAKGEGFLNIHRL